MKNSRRVLWEIRQRYGITSGSNTAPPASSATPTPPSSPTRRTIRPRNRIRRWVLLGLALVIVGGGVFGYKILAAGNKISLAERSILGQLKDLLFVSGNTLKGEQENRINVLLMAVGGEGHRGENLADTIMVVSIRPETHDVGLLSIPRDLYVQVPHEEYFTKINAVHAYGESKEKDGGPKLMSEVVTEITGQPIHYFARVDFTAFKHVVDAVGGIDITIENSFYDYWHKISFPAGTERMNGERALAYVRARYIEGPEGGDFRRAARQQQVLFALREKAFSPATAFDFAAMNTILSSLADNVRTDMELWEMRRFYELARTVNHDQTRSIVLTTGHDGVLVGSTEILGGTPASILRPRTGDYSEIHTLAENIFGVGSTTARQSPAASLAPTPTATPTPTASLAPASSTIEIRNGTLITGLAARTQDQLQEKGYQVKTIGNAQNRNRTETVVYIPDRRHQDNAVKIAELLNAKTDTAQPEGEAPAQTDILIILGEDAND